MERCLEWRFLRRKFDIKQTRRAIKVKFYAKHVVRRAFSSKTSLSSHAAITIPNCNCQQCCHHAAFTQLRQGFPFNWSNSALDRPLSFPFILIDASFKIHQCKAIISSWGRLIIYRSTLSGSPTNRVWWFYPAALLKPANYRCSVYFPLSFIKNIIKRSQLTVLKLGIPDAPPMLFVAATRMVW